jgi:hypothetical protein
LVRNFDNFGGIFELSQLSQIKLVSLPISLIVLIDRHWISMYVTENTLELMDSAGFLRFAVKHKEFRNFLCPLIRFKKFKVSPQLQTDGSKSCGLYAVIFLYLRTFTDISLCNFCNSFTTDFVTNDKLVNKIYDVIFDDEFTQL